MTVQTAEPEDPATGGADRAGRRGLSRRTVMGAGAWTLPTIALAIATPAAAASGSVPSSGAISFVNLPFRAAPGEAFAVTGIVSLSYGVYPLVQLAYSEGFSGPATATPDSGGFFSVSVVGPEVPRTGEVLASATADFSGDGAVLVVDQQNLTIVQGPGETGVGSESTPMIVHLEWPDGSPVTFKTVVFSIDGDGAFSDGSTSYTGFFGSDGTATSLGVIPTAVGPLGVVATADHTTPDHVTSTLLAFDPTPILTMIGGPAEVYAGIPGGQPAVVRAARGDGSGALGLPITFTLTAGGVFTDGSDTCVVSTNSDGIAISLGIGATQVGPITLTASALGAQPGSVTLGIQAIELPHG